MATLKKSFLQCTSHLLKNKRKYDVIIIGGGHNGLVCSYYLAKAGKSVCILEKRSILGGAAVTEEIVPGFKFSRASYVLGLLRPQIMQDMELKKHGLKLYQRNPGSYTPLHEKYWEKLDAKSLTLGLDSVQNIKEIAKFSIRDSQMFAKYESYLNKYVESLNELLETAPPDVKKYSTLGFIESMKQIKEYSPLLKAARNLSSDLPDFFKFLASPSESILNYWFESEPLRATLATDSVIGTMASPKTPGTGYVLLHHLMGEINGVRGAWGFPEGGMGAVTESMAKAAKSAGVDLFVNQTVSEILVDDKRKACGVLLEDQEIELRSEIVVSNATPDVTFSQLVNEDLLPQEFIRELTTIDYSSPVCKINVALSRLPNFIADSNPLVLQPHHQCTIHLNCEKTEFIDEAFTQAKMGLVPYRPLIEMTIPSSLDPTIAPNGAHVALLFTQYVPLCSGELLTSSSTIASSSEMASSGKTAFRNHTSSDNLTISSDPKTSSRSLMSDTQISSKSTWNSSQSLSSRFSKATPLTKNLRDEYLKKVFDCVEDYAPGFMNSVIGYEVLMPSDLEKEFGLTGGNIFHGAISPNQLFVARPTVFRSGPTTPVEGLFLCGAGIHPGGGVMGAPGYIASKVILREMNK